MRSARTQATAWGWPRPAIGRVTVDPEEDDDRPSSAPRGNADDRGSRPATAAGRGSRRPGRPPPRRAVAGRAGRAPRRPRTSASRPAPTRDAPRRQGHQLAGGRGPARARRGSSPATERDHDVPARCRRSRRADRVELQDPLVLDGRRPRVASTPTPRRRRRSRRRPRRPPSTTPTWPHGTTAERHRAPALVAARSVTPGTRAPAAA